MKTIEFFLTKLRSGAFTRIVGFGSSNTERHRPGMHWLDCFELACRSLPGAQFSVLNSGRGGETAKDLLARIERDCLVHQPDLVFLTVGGNDSSPLKGFLPEEYRKNLEMIISRIRSAGGHAVLQTYYSFDLENADPAHGPAFLSFMQTARETAAGTDCMLIDHLARWERLRIRCAKVYRRLMADPAHVNATGNMLLGLDIVRAFGLELPEDPLFREARGLQALLDILSGAPESRA